ncbi:MAG: transglycosylase SLT domain-containing protein [Thermodesulfovibrionales bacterium]|nr:transglycosylase SLT domain-containing protein [Thermodesulfovibrionales bacterium]
MPSHISETKSLKSRKIGISLLFSAIFLFVLVPIVYADVNKPDDDAVAQHFSNPLLAMSESQEKLTVNPQKGAEAEVVISTQQINDAAKADGAINQDLQASGKNQNNNGQSPLGISYGSNTTASKAVSKSMTLFTEKMKERFALWLERSARYLEIMKEVLKEKGMPEELVFLPLIESGFNVNAYSRARAVGPWQFIAATGKRYGLIIDWWRDERKDPVKSTMAAAEYLKDLYGMFGSWKLALAAYNAGEGKIMKAIKRSGAEDYWALLHTKQIRNETKNYVPHYVAAAMIANAPEDYGFYNLVYQKPLEYDEVTLNEPVDIEVIAKCSGSTVEEIRGLNPELRRWVTPLNTSQYTIRIPHGEKETFLSTLEKIPAEERVSADIYKVKKGDDLKKVAKKAGVPLIAILDLNSMSGIEKLKAGDVIKIPPKDKFYADMDDKMALKKSSKKVAVKKQSIKGGKKVAFKGVKSTSKAKKI